MKLWTETYAKPIVATDELFSGGEGTIYRVPGLPGSVAKVFHGPMSDGKEKLLALMRQGAGLNSVQSGRACFASPQTILFSDPARTVTVGYVMPFFAGMEAMFERFRVGTVARTQGYRGRVRIASNLAWGVEQVHERGLTIGDLNESNVLISRDGCVGFIDVGSWQVREGTVVWRCGVGKDDYTPPELMHVSFSDVDRGPEHDRFALAVLLWQITLGGHPFAAHYTGSGSPLPRRECIQRGYWPYADYCPPEYEPLRKGRAWSRMAPEIREMFEQAFVAGHANPSLRPKADDWAIAFQRLEAAWFGRKSPAKRVQIPLAAQSFPVSRSGKRRVGEKVVRWARFGTWVAVPALAGVVAFAVTGMLYRAGNSLGPEPRAPWAAFGASRDVSNMTEAPGSMRTPRLWRALDGAVKTNCGQAKPRT